MWKGEHILEVQLVGSASEMSQDGYAAEGKALAFTLAMMARLPKVALMELWANTNNTRVSIFSSSLTLSLHFKWHSSSVRRTSLATS